MRRLLCILLSTSCSLESFSTTRSRQRVPRHRLFNTPFFVSSSTLDKDLSPDERSTVAVVRKNGPSVAFVTSLWPMPSARRRPDSNLPPGQPLGSGSAFVVDSQGYLVTNYHVIERAYRIQEARSMMDQFVLELSSNITQATGWSLDGALQRLLTSNAPPLPQVYVRINSATLYQNCSIVGVKPEFDVAVLKIDTNETLPAVTFGSSSDLLVGQDLIAIGNPFGLDQTVTTGVVSALNRELRSVGPNGTPASPIRNCIQTDCAINPGNSGGPLLNSMGQVVGVNTAIVTTSGSNAGIGFAVPSDPVRPIVMDIIRADKRTSQPQKARLGVAIVKCTGENSTLASRNWIAQVDTGSPAEKVGMRPLRVFEQDASVQYGDAIVAVGGNEVRTYEELQKQMDIRAPGEKVQVTLEDRGGERRVVYLTLS